MTTQMNDARIAFNVVTFENFQAMIESVEQYGPGLEPPTYHEVKIFGDIYLLLHIS